MATGEKSMEYRILEAAEQLFLEQGFAKTTTSQIAESVGCNQALVHYYYRTKDNLFDKIFEEKARVMVTNFLNVQGEGATFKQRLGMMIRGHFNFLMANRKLPVFLFNEMSSNPDRIKSLLEVITTCLPKDMLADIDAELKREIKLKRIRPISSIDLIFTIVSLNLVPFIIQPIIMQPVILDRLGLTDVQVDMLLEQRREENVLTVMGRLRPDHL